jgi:hypothetical protein
LYHLELEEKRVVRGQERIGETRLFLLRFVQEMSLEDRSCPQPVLWVCAQPGRALNYRGSSSDKTPLHGKSCGWVGMPKGRQENRDRTGQK